MIKFNLNYCRRFSPEKLRKIYNGEPPEVLDKLINEIYPEHQKAEKPEKQKRVKKTDK